jgi:YD repeat-containing protein
VSGECDGEEVLWQYDAYGNLLDDGTYEYEYDAAMRLTSVMDGVSTSTFAYNGDGDRVSQTVDGTLTTYVLDTATPLTMMLGTRQWRVPSRRRAKTAFTICTDSTSRAIQRGEPRALRLRRSGEEHRQ